MSQAIEKLAYKLSEAAQATAQSEKYLLECIHSGTLQAKIIRGKWIILKEELERWLKSHV